MSLVIVGYWLSTITQGASLSLMLIIKTSVLGLSFAVTSIKCRNIAVFKTLKNNWSSRSFIILAILATLPTFYSGVGFYRTLTLILPLYYIIQSVTYLIGTFGLFDFIKKITLAFLLIYSIPLFSYLIYGGGFAVYNIYGYSEESNGAFVSNHYGWSSAIVITSIFIYWRLVRLSYLIKILFAALLLLAFYFLFISGSRSGLVSLALILILIISKRNIMGLRYKISLILITTFFTINLLKKQDSALNFVVDKTKSQIETGGDSRTLRTEKILAYFEEKPVLWFTGIGLFNKAELKNRIGFYGYHNSYWDVLFGGGIVLFLIFLRLAVWYQLKAVIFSSNPFVLLFPIFLIIPFFESNLTSGQFLFFPWFVVVSTLAHRDFTTKIKRRPGKSSYRSFHPLSSTA